MVPLILTQATLCALPDRPLSCLTPPSPHSFSMAPLGIFPPVIWWHMDFNASADTMSHFWIMQRNGASVSSCVLWGYRCLPCGVVVQIQYNKVCGCAGFTLSKCRLPFLLLSLLSSSTLLFFLFSFHIKFFSNPLPPFLPPPPSLLPLSYHLLFLSFFISSLFLRYLLAYPLPIFLH